MEDLEERLRSHLNWTHWILICIPFILGLIGFVYWIRDFLIQYGFQIYCVCFAGLVYFYVWIWLMFKVTIYKDEE